MQLLAAMQLRGSGTGPGQATAWLQAAAWLRMGPMGPRGLGPWALWAPGAHTAIIFRLDTAIIFRPDTAIIFRLDNAIIGSFLEGP